MFRCIAGNNSPIFVKRWLKKQHSNCVVFSKLLILSSSARCALISCRKEGFMDFDYSFSFHLHAFIYLQTFHILFQLSCTDLPLHTIFMKKISIVNIFLCLSLLMTVNKISLSFGQNKTYEDGLKQSWLTSFHYFWHFVKQTTNW